MLAWSEVGGATGYNLIISQRGNGGYGAEGPENLVLTRTGLTSTSYPVNLDELPDDATQFQWRVQAVNSVGTSPQSSPSYFQTLAGIADVGAASTPNVASGAVIAVSPETNRTENSTTPRNIIIPPKGLIPAHLADDDSQSIELPAVDDGSAKLVDDNNQLNNQLAPDTSGRYYPPQALDKFYKYLGVFAAIITIITAPTIFKSRKPKTITNIYNFKTLNFGESPASDNKIEGESSDVIHEDNLGDLDTHGYA